MVYTSAPCEFEKCKLVHLSLCCDRDEYMPGRPQNSLRTVVISPRLSCYATLPGCRLAGPNQTALQPHPLILKQGFLGQHQHRESFHQGDNTRPSAFHSWPDTDSEWNVTDRARLLSDLQMPVSVKWFWRKIKLRLYCHIHLECITKWRHEMELRSQLCGGLQRCLKQERTKMAPTSPRSLYCCSWHFQG